MEEKIRHEKGSGIRWKDGTIFPTIVMIFPDGEKFEFPEKNNDRIAYYDLECEESMGANYPLPRLRNLRFSIAFSCRKRQAECVDIVWQKLIHDLDFVKAQMDSMSNINDPKVFEQFSAKLVGMFAFIALNAPEPYSTKANEILINYKIYVSDMMYVVAQEVKKRNKHDMKDPVSGNEFICTNIKTWPEIDSDRCPLCGNILFEVHDPDMGSFKQCGNCKERFRIKESKK